MSKAFALAVPHEYALSIRDDVGFLQTIRTRIVKSSKTDAALTREGMDHAIRQLVSRSVIAEEVVDVFEAAGLS